MNMNNSRDDGAFQVDVRSFLFDKVVFPRLSSACISEGMFFKGTTFRLARRAFPFLSTGQGVKKVIALLYNLISQTASQEYF